ncbi:hypothetical protein B0J17DRAFT_152088 [Rhizoctonia solani]|nr:hypothetical protein B0J17DRAFT_152088 [Rhizoctonia solani]
MIYNITLDAASPMIKYDSAWTDGFDPTSSQYHQESFYCTVVNGASADVTFHGTAVYVYGAKRTNHGYFRVTLNDEDSGLISGRPLEGAPEEFRVLLYKREGLANRENSLKFTNVHEEHGRDWIDIDYIVISREVDVHVGVKPAVTTHEGFTYSSSSQWEKNSNEGRNSTSRVTNSLGATATLQFQGPHVSLYGSTGPNFGAFQVQVDDREPVVLNATTGIDHPNFPITLFTTGGLGDGHHRLSVTNLQAGAKLAIEYAEFTPRTSHSGGSNASLIGGIVGGVVGALVMLAALGWFIARKRKYARCSNSEEQFPPMLINPQWDDRIHVTPYTDDHIQPPLGYVNPTPAVPTTRKSHLLATTSSRSQGELRNGPSPQPGPFISSDSSDTTSIHEVDAGTLPPLYHQVSLLDQLDMREVLILL